MSFEQEQQQHPTGGGFVSQMQRLQALLSSPWSAMCDHARLLYSHFDPVVVKWTSSESAAPASVPVSPASASIHRRAHHLFPICLLTSTVVMGWLVLPYCATGHLIWPRSAEWRTSPHLFSHQFSARPVWAQFDVATALSVSDAITFFSMLEWWLGEDRVAPRFAFTLVRSLSSGSKYFAVGSRALPESQSKEACRFYDFTVRLCLRSVFVLSLVFTLTFYYGQVWLNDAYTFEWQYILLWGVIFTPTMFYILFTIVSPMSFIMILSTLIGIRQRVLLSDLRALLTSMQVQRESMRAQRQSIVFTNYGNNVRSHQVKFALSCIRFLLLNHRLVEVCAQIAAYKPLVTVRLASVGPFNLMIGCYMLYSMLSANLATSEPMYLVCVTYILLVYNTFLFFVVHQCARVEGNNRAIESVNRKVARLLLQTSANTNLSPCDRVRIQSLAMPTRGLRQYCFQLFGHIRVTNKTYYLIISYGTAFFMFIFTRSSKR